MSSLFLRNRLGAHETQELATLAFTAGATGVSQLAKVGNNGKAPKNNARDIKRLALHGCDVPKPYMVDIPAWDPISGHNVHVQHPTLLPHELLAYMIANGKATVEELSDLSTRTDQTLDAKKKALCAKYGIDDHRCIAMGFHGDGVPFQKSTHKHSCTEVLSWNLLCDRDGKRYMFCNINKDFLCCCGCAGRCTLDALLDVYVWSMNVLLEGKHPCQRHDGGDLDGVRNANKSKPLGFHGLLLQVRGDWQWYSQVLNFPTWNSNFMCWRCKATQDGACSYKSCGPKAA